MEILLLGTAAAEAWPAPFCRCDACREARRLGGKNARSRSGALIDNIVKIDFGPDTTAQMARERRDLGAVTTLLFTHAHDDHFTPAELQYRRSMFVAGEPPAHLNVYGPVEVMEPLRLRYENPTVIDADFHAAVEPFRQFVTGDGTGILPLAAAHIPGALLFRLERGGKKLLYGHDTGEFPAETVDALAGDRLDVALLDCTYGASDRLPAMHMSVGGVVNTVDRLRMAGAIDSATRVIATHISHHCGMLHDRLAELLNEVGVELAYDGMIITV